MFFGSWFFFTPDFCWFSSLRRRRWEKALSPRSNRHLSMWNMCPPPWIMPRLEPPKTPHTCWTLCNNDSHNSGLAIWSMVYDVTSTHYPVSVKRREDTD